MGKTLKAYLLGNPILYLDDSMVSFPFAKINALIYYLLINKTASRDELAALLWPDKSESAAKKNLRNSIYQANKHLGGEYIISLAKQILAFSEELTIQCDVAALLAEDDFDPTCYRDEFLHNFYVKGCEEYDLWINSVRIYYQSKFSEKLSAKVQNDIQNHRFGQVERHIHQLTQIDEFDESHYRLLMSYYHLRGMPSKAIETYVYLTDLLNSELGIGPSEETIALYKETIKSVQKHQDKPSHRLPVAYFSRPLQMAKYEQVITDFIADPHSQVMLITGETGNGKTEFVDRMQQINDHHLERVTLLAQSVYAKSPGYMWDKFLQGLKDVAETKQSEKFQALRYSQLQVGKEKILPYDQLVDLERELEAILTSSPLLVTIDQFEQVDLASLRLFNQLILEGGLSILFVCIGNGQWLTEVERILDHLQATGLSQTIQIPPLTADECNHFIDQLSQGLTPLSDNDKEKIYAFSGGNLLFIHELVRLHHEGKSYELLNDEMKVSIDKQCSFLSIQAMEILETLSFFPNAVPVPLLTSLINLPMMQMKRELQELFRRNLIAESCLDQDTVMIRIKAERIKFYLYSRQSQTIKRLMHGKIADTLIDNQGTYLFNSKILNQIAYHCRKADRTLEALEYELAYLQRDLKFKHELFPVYNQEQIAKVDPSPARQDEAEEKMMAIQQELKVMEDSYSTDSAYLKLQLRFLYIEGRFFIRIGHYEKGIENILSVIVKAKDIGETDYLLRAYLQMIYYCIQIDNAEDMAHYIDFAFELAVQQNDHESIGILLRLRGLQAIMVGNINLAEKYLRDSINMLTVNPMLENKYGINLAAAYDYLSEIALIEEDYDESIARQEVALAYIYGKDSQPSEVVLLIDMGIAHFAKGDYTKAFSYHQHALEIADHATFVWRRPQLLAFMAVTKALLNDFESAYQYLEACQDFLIDQKEKSRRDVGILNWAKAILSSLKWPVSFAAKLESRVLDLDRINNYKERATANLSLNRDVFERRYLDKTLGNN
ncbi:BTAD domain-containing putative transcriptional regulator [Aerococcus kribbianus]|uniref:BTAD domain-containing putative transcriptional regulator n=1 Tax=Aerococcus kribbianus TaxID=2999064 RepID=A0A9X3FXE2_9LACT|nr:MULTISPECIES: BTAD domain-containing putative transcriptional regulator [unclassified Aerococcus]MCZ0718005.1 BTAD domain-containing putative transcriptional regulator [Aerococcus sp. YH-aer221]MCZ0726292.1 BTAD domain-containing putative transcriptional regulator [Aerococcus sp. YH-aer222]